MTHDQALSDDIDTYVTPELRGTMREVAVKQKQRLMHELLANLTDASMELDASIADWQTLLKAYLVKKYGDGHESYLKVLKDLQILA